MSTPPPLDEVQNTCTLYEEYDCDEELDSSRLRRPDGAFVVACELAPALVVAALLPAGELPADELPAGELPPLLPEGEVAPLLPAGEVAPLDAPGAAVVAAAPLLSLELEPLDFGLNKRPPTPLSPVHSPSFHWANVAPTKQAKMINAFMSSLLSTVIDTKVRQKEYEYNTKTVYRFASRQKVALFAIDFSRAL